ncbi:hypothetical protein FRC08_009275, partial [Ceratobasidium sp. 394]
MVHPALFLSASLVDSAMDPVRSFEHLVLLAASLSSAIVTYLVYLWLLPKPLLHVPHNPVTSIWGDISELDSFMEGGKRNIADYFTSFATKFGPLSQVMVARARIVLVADRAEYERLLLKTKSTEQSRWTNGVFGTVIPTSQISLPTNEMWKRHRQLTGPSMSRRYLEHMSARVSAGANNLTRLWARKVELIGNKAFDADRYLKLAIMDTILSITMGDSPSFIDVIHASLPTSPSSLSSGTHSAQFPQPDPPPLHKALRAMMASLERIQFTALPLPIARILTWMSPSWRKSYGIISEFLNNKIGEARAREAEIAEAKQGEGLATDADCVVDMIAQREAREEAETFDKGELLDELMAYVLAGQDTTAATLMWLFKYLPLDVEIQQRLYDELCTAFGPVSDDEGPLDFTILNDSSKVPVLEAVVAETQR